MTPLRKMVPFIQFSLGADGSITLKWNLDKWDVRVWTGLKWVRIEFSDGLL
jgi:hypothetical protein